METGEKDGRGKWGAGTGEEDGREGRGGGLAGWHTGPWSPCLQYKLTFTFQTFTYNIKETVIELWDRVSDLNLIYHN